MPSVLSDLTGLVRARDPDRYLCAQFAPPDKRSALLALTAFGAEVADIPSRVTEPTMGQLRVSWWRDVLVRIEAGIPPVHPVAESLAAVWQSEMVERCEAILDACEIGFADPDSRDDPSSRIAAFTQQAWLAVLGVDEVAAAAAALRAGSAWALTRGSPTNESQDAAEDHLRRIREKWSEIPKAALPALLPGAIAASVIRRTRRGKRPSGRVQKQMTLLRAALLGRF